MTRPMLRWLIVLPLAAILVVAALHAARALLAGNDVLAGRLYARMGWGSALPGATAWTATRGRLSNALGLEPDNPTTIELMGLLASQRVDDPIILRDATPHFVRALTLRPVAALTWANLAESRYQVGDTSRVFEVALQNAAKLGPSEPHAQRIVSHYGLAVFDEVSPDTRKAIEGMVAAGMRRAPGEILPIAQRRGRLDVACRYQAETRGKVDPRWQRLCATVVPG